MARKKNELISVIVPVYNVERYLKKCLDSIINQTYKDIEIILIDDGSTDKSGNICDLYALKDNRIKVIHKVNGGLSSARNTGLEVATGKLIGFVDSDDYIKAEMYEKLKENMDTYKSDIAFCTFYKKNRYNSKINNNIPKYKEGLYKDKDKFINLKNISSVTWNKLYKKEIFKDIRYPEGKIFEDIAVICDIADKAKKISYTNEPLYYYRARKSGISKSYNSTDRIDALSNKIDYYRKKKYLDLIAEEEYNKVNEIISYSCKVKAKSTKDSRIISLIDEANTIAKRLSTNESLDDNKRNNINSFLNNNDKHYKKYRVKWNRRYQLNRIASYK